MLKFISRHKGIVRCILVICFVIITIALIKYFNSQILGLAVSFLIFFIFFMLLAFIDLHLTVKAMEELYTSCDCMPLYKRNEQFLKEKNPPNVKQNHIINYALCLHQMGKFNDALNLLLSITVTERSLINLKLIYYNNLSKVYGCLKNKDEAEKYYSISKDIYDNSLNNKLKNKYKILFTLSESEHFYRIGQYEKALSVIKSVEPSNLYEKVSKSYLLARISLKLNDIETAKKELDFVIKNGNTLYVVNEAKEILKKV